MQAHPDLPRQANSNSNTDGGLIQYDFIRQANDNWTTGQIAIRNLCARKIARIRARDTSGVGAGLYNILTLLSYNSFLPVVADLTSSKIHEELSNRFKIPAMFWSSVAQDASGFFGCQDTRDTRGDLENFSSHFRFLVKEAIKPTPPLNHACPIKAYYVWHRLGFYTTWIPSKNALVLCFGLPLSLKRSLSDVAQLHIEDPFSFHTILIEKVIALYDIALWSWRDLVRDSENNRISPDNPHPDYVTMHEMARHTIHSSETLAMAKETMTSLVREHEIFFEENSLLPARSMTLSKQTRRIFRSQITLLNCLYLRSKALEERLQNEINLVVFAMSHKKIELIIPQAFNTVAQHDSRIAVQIGKATQIDSAAMKTISVLGLAFLPGTFICALFSTSFFNFSPGNATDPQRWSVSEKFWIYWVVAIPVTVFTVVCWTSWHCVTRDGR
ncbi:uncharacterized protein PAC_18489 [Phialocephala subalpina]|uniref:Uncharacterized protein n=1 Tax=Phialocephala subalpina TaxID=576137 RepID=A0A1L7XU90_9HELO|nr:uncharacterized protein PAC_18489 [Phialocephala subalpina]